jgi:hypothetical protein
MNSPAKSRSTPYNRCGSLLGKQAMAECKRGGRLAYVRSLSPGNGVPELIARVRTGPQMQTFSKLLYVQRVPNAAHRWSSKTFSRQVLFLSRFACESCGHAVTKIIELRVIPSPPLASPPVPVEQT